MDRFGINKLKEVQKSYPCQRSLKPVVLQSLSVSSKVGFFSKEDSDR